MKIMRGAGKFHPSMIRNYAKQPPGFFTRMAVKVAAFTMLQYFNFINHKPIGQGKYALIQPPSRDLELF